MRTALAETEEKHVSFSTRVLDQWQWPSRGSLRCRQLARLLRRSAWMASVLHRFCFPVFAVAWVSSRVFAAPHGTSASAANPGATHDAGTEKVAAAFWRLFHLPLVIGVRSVPTCSPGRPRRASLPTSSYCQPFYDLGCGGSFCTSLRDLANRNLAEEPDALGRTGG